MSDIVERLGPIAGRCSIEADREIIISACNEIRNIRNQLETATRRALPSRNEIAKAIADRLMLLRGIDGQPGPKAREMADAVIALTGEESGGA